MKTTLYLTKEEIKTLADFYWNFYGDDITDYMFEALQQIAEGTDSSIKEELCLTEAEEKALVDFYQIFSGDDDTENMLEAFQQIAEGVDNSYEIKIID